MIFSVKVASLDKQMKRPNKTKQKNATQLPLLKSWEPKQGVRAKAMHCIPLYATCNAGDPSSICGSGRSPGKGIGYLLQYSWASLVAQFVKNPSAVRETWVQSLGWEDPLEKGKNPLQYSCLDNPHEPRSLVDCSPRGRKGSDTTEQLSIMHNTYIICVCVRACAVLSHSFMSHSV